MLVLTNLNRTLSTSTQSPTFSENKLPNVHLQSSIPVFVERNLEWQMIVKYKTINFVFYFIISFCSWFGF